MKNVDVMSVCTEARCADTTVSPWSSCSDLQVNKPPPDHRIMKMRDYEEAKRQAVQNVKVTYCCKKLDLEPGLFSFPTKFL